MRTNLSTQDELLYKKVQKELGVVQEQVAERIASVGDIIKQMSTEQARETAAISVADWILINYVEKYIGTVKILFFKINIAKTLRSKVQDLIRKVIK